MIFHTEQTHIGEPVNPEDSPWKPTEIFGIPEVDAVIGPALKDGGVAVISGSTGSGKTVLAGQVAACMAMSGQNVHFISTEVEEPELLARTLSCLAPWPYSMLKDGFGLEDMGGFKLPVVFPDDEEFSVRALHPYRMLHKHLRSTFRPDFKVDPMTVLNEVLDDIFQADVSCIILDLLQLDGYLDGKFVNQTEVATEVIEFLQAVAYAHQIPVFVFCQRNDAGENQDRKEVKSGRVGGISEFPQIEKLADVTIELTYPVSRPNERLVGPGTYSRDRHFIVRTQGKGGERWMPVTADFEFQRFIGREESGNLVNEDDDQKFRKRVLSGSVREGFVKFPRELWNQIQEIGHLPTRIVYVAVVLNSNHLTGKSNWSNRGLENLLNMDDSVLRRALLKLESLNLIIRPGDKGRGKRRDVHVVDYKKYFQNPDASNYMVLVRNLLDPSRADLRADNEVLAVWLHLLFETRYTKDIDGFLDRGQWPVGYSRLAEALGLKVEVVRLAIDKLEDQGRITRRIDNEWGHEIVMIPNFDQYQRLVPWPANDTESGIVGGRTTDELRTNCGRTADELRTNCGRTTDEPRTNHGRTTDEPRTNHGR